MSRLLLDTHAFLWLKTAPERLGTKIAEMADPGTDLILSPVTTWEIAIKWSLGKLPLPAAPDRWLPQAMVESKVGSLAVQHTHALRVATLPPHHRDPFDRLLVAQAIAENVRIATADPAIRQYDPPILWLGPPDQSR